MSNSEDIAAINQYMQSQPVNTPAAAKVKDQWVKFHEGGAGSAWFPSQSVYDEARNIRNAFNLANARNAEEKAQVERVMTSGLTTEELKGEARRTTAEGNYVVSPPAPPPSDPWLPTKTKIAIGVGAAALIALGALKKIYIDPFLRFGK